MVALSSTEGFLAFVLLVICTCTHVRRNPRLRETILSERGGIRGVMWKASVIGVRLQWLVATLNIGLAIVILMR